MLENSYTYNSKRENALSCFISIKTYLINTRIMDLQPRKNILEKSIKMARFMNFRMKSFHELF